MSRIRKILMLLLAGTPFMGGRTEAGLGTAGTDAYVPPAADPDNPSTLRPLNYPSDNLFAAHRSHSSHASHRSSSGGGYAAPRQSERATDQYAPPPASSSAVPRRNTTAQPTDPGRPEAVSPQTPVQKTPTLSNAEKLRLQVMRVQIALTSLGLYSGTVNGVLDDKTKEALRHFQTVKGMSSSGLMTTETLNALGVPAVQ